MKLILDTNVVVSGFLWRTTPRSLIDAAVEGRIELATSTALLAELSSVISRTKFARKLAEQGISARLLVDRYARIAVRVEPAQIRRTIAADANDDAVLACALGTRADLIVSGDQHLLNLKRYHGMRIVNPAQALASVRNI